MAAAGHVAAQHDAQPGRDSEPAMVSLETSRLASFLRERGGTVHESLELFAQRPGSAERGAFAIEPIKKGEVLLRLPAAAVMRACDDGPECDWMPEAARTASPMLRTALFLMREMASNQFIEEYFMQ